MQLIVKNIIKNKFRDFNGMRVGGQLVISDQLINEVLQLGLASARKPAAKVVPKKAQTAIATLDLQELLNQLEFEQLEFRSEAGKMVIEIKGALSS